MLIARVVGTLVATQKNHNFEGAKLLLVQPTTPTGEPSGGSLLAIDSVQAGVGDRVLVVVEGKAAQAALRRSPAPVDAAIVGVIDHVDVHETAGAPRGDDTRAGTRDAGAQT
jgi:ethanolamine utilization protein EutN